MPNLSFEISDNWKDHPELQRSLNWRTASGGNRFIIFETIADEKSWLIRLNDFPDKPLFTLLIEDTEIIHFDNWPEFWGTRPTLPKV